MEASLATRSSSPKYASRAPTRCSIATFRDSNDFNYEIYRINAHGGAQTNLTHNPSSCLAPAYCRTTPGSPSKASGTAPRYLQDECRRASQTRRTFNTMYDADPSWQPLLW